MKFLIFIFTGFLLNAQAVELTVTSDQPGRKGIITFKTSAKSVQQHRSSNLPSSMDSLWFGDTYPLESKEVAKIISELERIKIKLQRVDNFLREEGTEGLNSVNNTIHGKMISLDGYQVKEGSLAFKDLLPLVVELEKQQWKIKNGIELTGTPSSITYVTNGKRSLSTKFEAEKSCQREMDTYFCRIKNHGPIVIK